MDLTTNGAVITDSIKYAQGQMAYPVNSIGTARHGNTKWSHFRTWRSGIWCCEVASNGHSLKISSVTDLVPDQDKIFAAWLVDGNYAASGYPRSLGQFIKDGTLSYNENLVNA